MAKTADEEQIVALRRVGQEMIGLLKTVRDYNLSPNLSLTAETKTQIVVAIENAELEGL